MAVVRGQNFPNSKTFDSRIYFKEQVYSSKTEAKNKAKSIRGTVDTMFKGKKRFYARVVSKDGKHAVYKASEQI